MSYPDNPTSGESSLRRPNESERALVSALLTAEFPGRSALVQQLNQASVRTIDRDGSLKFEVQGSVPADVIRRIPIEADTTDIDGTTIHVLLHVVGGFLDELEVYREDSSPVQGRIRPETLRVVLF
jgi:hypothetical protein